MATNRIKLEEVINQAKEVLESANPDYVIALCRYIFRYYPRALEATRLLGEAYTEKKLFDEADALFVYVLAADPHDVLGYVDRGFIAYERGDVDEAIKYYERAIEIDPNIEQLRAELLRLYKERYGSSRAKLRLTKAGLANHRMRDGFYNQAIDEYLAILNETPDRLDIQAWLMEAYWRNRDYVRAEKAAHELLESHPYLIKANLILWHIYGVRRHQDKAAVYLEKAHALDPLNLVAERLFENAMVAENALNYLSMLGVAALPAFDPETVERESEDQPLLPVWVTADAETDRRLGLKGEELTAAGAVAATSAEEVSAESDWLAKLLEETEQQLQAQNEQAQVEEAQADLESLRQSESSDEVFSLFDEIEESAPQIDLNTPRPAQSSVEVTPDLELQSFNADEIGTIRPFQAQADNQPIDSLFESFEASSNVLPDVPLQPARFDEPASEAERKGQTRGFDLNFDEEPEPFSLDLDSSPEKFDLGLLGDMPEPFKRPENETQFELSEFGITERDAIRPDKMSRFEEETPPPPFNLNELDLNQVGVELGASQPEETPAKAEKTEEEFKYGVDLFAPTLLPEQFDGQTELEASPFELPDFLRDEEEKTEPAASVSPEEMPAPFDFGEAATLPAETFSAEVASPEPIFSEESAVGEATTPATAAQEPIQPAMQGFGEEPVTEVDPLSFLLEEEPPELQFEPVGEAETPPQAEAALPETEPHLTSPEAEPEAAPAVGDLDDDSYVRFLLAASDTLDQEETSETPATTGSAIQEEAFETGEPATFGDFVVQEEAPEEASAPVTFSDTLEPVAFSEMLVQEEQESFEPAEPFAFNETLAQPGSFEPAEPVAFSEAPVQEETFEPVVMEEAQAQIETREPEAPFEFETETGNEVGVAPRLEAHAFHRRDERGPIPEAIARMLTAEAPVQAESEAIAAGPEWEAAQATPAFNTLAAEAAQTSDISNAPTQPDFAQGTEGPGIESSDKENEAMPIKRGGQDEDNNVFDWEKEELPDYLRDFAIDEDEVARHSRTVNPPIGATDMTTGPARIRPPREPEAPAPGDLPDWLNPGANRQPPQINMPGNDQPSLGNARSGASSGPLPGWLDANEPGRGPAVPPGMNDLDLGDLQPFNPEGADGFGGPSLQPPAMSGLGSMQPPAPPPSRSQPPAFQPPAAPSPFGMPDDLGVGDIAPFSLEGLDGGGFGTSAPLPPPQPRQAPPAQPPASRPQPQAFQPPAMPSTPQYQPSASPFGGIGDELGDIAPFNPLDFGEAPTAPAPPVPPPTPRAQPQSFQPPAMPQFQPPAPSPSAPFGMPGGGFDDLGLDDLQPFSLEDAGGSPAPPPARPTPPPAAPQFPSQPPAFQPPAMPQFPTQSNEPAAFSLDDLGVGDIAPFNPFGDAAPPPAPAPQSPAMPFNPPGFNAMPPIGGEGFVQAGPGSLFGNKEPAPPAGRPEQNMFSTDLPDDDIEPFSATGMDIPGLNGPTSFRGGSRLDDLPDEPIYRQPRPRNTQPEPEIEVEPGHEKPLQSFGWLKDRAARKRREEEEEEENAPGKGKSLFQKLAERRNQQLKQQPTEETPSPAEDLEVSGIDRFADYQSFEEIERQAELQEQGFAQPTPPTSPAKPTEPAFSFDFGSKQEEEPLAFEFRGDEPTPRPRPQETVQPFSFDFETPEAVPETPAPPETVQPFSFDFGATEPRPQPAETVQPFSFDLGATEQATQPEAEEAVQPFDFGVGATEPEPMEPFNFDLGQPAPPAHPEPAFSFDFGGAKPEPEPEPAFDFNFEREQAPAAPQAFKLDEFHAQVEAEQAQQAPAMPDFDFGDLGMPSAPTQPGNEMFGTEEDLTDFNVEYAAPKAEQPKVEPPKPAPEPEQPSAEPFTFDLGELVAQPTPAPAEVRPRLQEQPVAKPEPAVPVVPKTPEPVVAGNGDLNSYLSRVKQNPKDLEANLYLANNFYEQSKFPEAITHYGNAIKSANADTLKEIVAKLEQITKSDEANPRFHRVLGDAYMKQGQYHWALSEYSKALPTGAKR